MGPSKLPSSKLPSSKLPNINKCIPYPKLIIGGWVIAPFQPNGDIYDYLSQFTDEYRNNYLSTRNNNFRLCDRQLWANSWGDPSIVTTIKGVACNPRNKYKADKKVTTLDGSKLLYVLVPSVELLILLIFASMKYLKMDPQLNFFNLKFLAIIAIIAGISVALFIQEENVTQGHVLRIVIGIQLTIISLLALRKLSLTN